MLLVFIKTELLNKVITAFNFLSQLQLQEGHITEKDDLIKHSKTEYKNLNILKISIKFKIRL